ncbi:MULTISPECIES: TetR family transcriptional regulator [unclassified Isoptericola]|uniref:TetR family transcriptional regulator n=1 Tax=unclassified Isoptericola TaxID=2623355 RepID=UPI0036580A6E
MTTETTSPGPGDPAGDATARPEGVQQRRTRLRRQEILDVAAATFANRGYNNASLAEIADEVGISAPAILHHFRSKEGLLTELLRARDGERVGDAADGSRPRGLAFLDHLVDTVARNAERPGITQLYTVLSAEAVTDGHPAQTWFRDRYVGLRAMVRQALAEALDDGELSAGTDLDETAAAVVAVMDGLQVQWLLDPERVDMVAVTRRTIAALLASLTP